MTLDRETILQSWDKNGVLTVALSFEKRVHLRIGETRVTPEVSLELPRAMAIAGIAVNPKASSTSR